MAVSHDRLIASVLRNATYDVDRISQKGNPIRLRIKRDATASKSLKRAASLLSIVCFFWAC
eukprot:6099471-Amphidinium_carterae.1